MNDPIKAKKADRWDALVAGGTSPDEATKTVEREFSVGAPATPSRPSVRVASESSSALPSAGAPKRYDGDMRTVKGVARGVADGAMLGFGDNAESLLFRTPLDKIRGEQAQFREEHPVLAPVSEIAGGLLSAGGAAKALTKAPKLVSLLASPTASVGRRLATATIGGAGVGAVDGAGKADGKDVFQGAAKGAAIGGATAGLLGTAGEAFRTGRNAVGSLLRGDATTGAKAAVGRFVESEAPATAGARRVMRRIGAGNSTLDDVAAREATAAPTLSFAEVVDDAAKPTSWRKGQGTQGLRIGRNMGRERDAIDKSLQERAADAPARFLGKVSDAQQLPEPRDAQAFKDEVVGAAMDEAGPKFAAAAPKAVPDGALATVLDRVKKLKAQGLDLWGNASIADDAFPEAITEEMTVGQLRTLRQELDSNISWGGDARNFDSIQRKANNRLKELRDDLDGLIKAAGGADQREGDAVVSAAMGKAESFKTGQDAMRATTPEGVTRTMASARDAEGARLGAASNAQAKLLAVPDGEGGRVSNPTFSAMGSPLKREKLRAGLPDEAAADAVGAERDLINREFETRQKVSGNSTTFANQSEGAEEFGSMPDWGSAISSPTRATMGLLGRVGARGLTGLNAEQATEMARLFAAGLPSQMPRTEALSLLRAALPKIQGQQGNSLLRRAVVGGQAGGASARP